MRCIISSLIKYLHWVTTHTQKHNQRCSQGCSASHLWNHMGFKQQLWCLPKLGKGTLCPNGCTNTGRASAPRTSARQGPAAQTPGDKANFAMEKNILKNSKKKKHESKNHLWCFWALHSSLLTLNSIPKAVAVPSLPTSTSALTEASTAIPKLISWS